ncbi:uncharacterized protein LOC133036768 [Cannabis sativa]|uniref:uncharacterized protein LOC133036768 n=1 Tax=Cannabis sativa TaxID=3483 RepID=UPI0029CA80BB|nr:uncharacterized protein LOC133036768 [Cannabis sativa]
MWLRNQSIPAGVDSGLWKKIWKLRVQPKVLHFGCRAMSGILATKVELNTKHVYVNSLCSFCNMVEESTMHVLVSCNFAKSCWIRSSLNITSFSQHYFYNWFQDLMSSNSGEQLEEALMVAWAIWNARNNLLWNQKSTTTVEVILSARTHLYQWQCAQQSKLEPPLSHLRLGRR